MMKNPWSTRRPQKHIRYQRGRGGPPKDYAGKKSQGGEEDFTYFVSLPAPEDK